MAENSDSLDESKKDEPEKASEKQASQTLSNEAQELFDQREGTTNSDRLAQEAAVYPGAASSGAPQEKNYPLARDREQDRSAVIAKGFPDLFLADNSADLGRSSKLQGQDVSSPNNNSKPNTDGTPSESAEKPDDSKENRKQKAEQDPLEPHPFRVWDLPENPFGDGRRAILIGDDHSARPQDRLREALRQLGDGGPSHVALEFVPSSQEMNDRLREYKEAKDRLAEAERSKKSEAEIQELREQVEKQRQQIRAEIERNFPRDDSGTPRIGQVTPDDVVEMIDVAHASGRNVVGLEPPGGSRFEAFVGELDAATSSSKDPDAQHARENFRRFFGKEDTPERRQAEAELEDYFRRMYGDDGAKERMESLRAARSGGFGFNGDFPAQSDLMNYRDGHFSERISAITDSGGTVVAFAGDVHFSHWQDGDERKEPGWSSVSHALGDRKHIVISARHLHHRGRI